MPHEARLQLYQVHAVTEGTDAQATVSVRLEEDGRIVTGQSADTDTVVASRQGLRQRAEPADRAAAEVGPGQRREEGQLPRRQLTVIGRGAEPKSRTTKRGPACTARLSRTNR